MQVGHQKPAAVLAGGIFELVGRGGFIAAVQRLPQLDLQLATPPYSNGCYTFITRAIYKYLLTRNRNRIARGFKSQTKKRYGNKHRITDTNRSQHSTAQPVHNRSTHGSQPSRSLSSPTHHLFHIVGLKDAQNYVTLIVASYH
ncbi:hypothetical protein T03_9786 [Trichinella britovi]|uniref:Uncharacterized protein n=1 Tax=Trichinella britovi TaxID=45882 RepID=A0A0V1C7X6_TRIBR|nr:hypothetical protein T03_9786 [Trichinella britovi]